jgi:hypothetical protein
MDFSKIIDFFKLSPKTFFGISLATGLLLFGPETIIQKMGLSYFVSQYRI